MTYNKEETKQSVERVPMIEMELGDKDFIITKICSRIQREGMDIRNE